MKETISTSKGAAPVGPYSQAIRANGFVFISGQIPLDPQTHEVVRGDIRVQSERALKNVATLLSAAGSSMDKVVRCVVYLVNMNEFAAMNDVYKTFFCENPPARTTIEVSALPYASLIEIEATALA